MPVVFRILPLSSNGKEWQGQRTWGRGGGYGTIAYTKPDACLSSICNTACARGNPHQLQLLTVQHTTTTPNTEDKTHTSGVMSLSANPVPPLVTIKLILAPACVHARIEAWIWSGSSGMIFVAATSHCVEAGRVDSFAWVKALRSRSVVRSAVVPAKVVVDTMRMPTRSVVVEVESRVPEAILSCLFVIIFSSKPSPQAPRLEYI